jgi:hypothetical protein
MKGLLKSKRALLLLTVVLLVGGIAIPVALSGHHFQQAHAASSNGNAQGLEGAWKTAIALHIKGGPPPFSGLITFAAGGGLVDTEQIDLAEGGTPGIGSWASTGADTFALQFYKLLVDNKGNLLTTVRFRLTGHLTADQNAFTSSGTFAGFDPSGKQIFSGTIDIHGTRIEAKGN